MRVVDGLGNGLHVIRGAVRRQRFVAHQFGEVLTLHQFHREVGLAVGFTHFVNRHDVRMLKPRRHLRLGTEPLEKLLAGELARQQELHRDDAVEASLSRAKNHTHPTARYLLDQIVVAEPSRRVGRLLGRVWQDGRGLQIKREQRDAFRAEAFQSAVDQR